ncbi:unnamed protein product [Urochloa humidicola]
MLTTINRSPPAAAAAAGAGKEELEDEPLVLGRERWRGSGGAESCAREGCRLPHATPARISATGPARISAVQPPRRRGGEQRGRR